MQKQLLALAIAAAVVAPGLAIADVKISGRMHSSIDFNDFDDDSGDEQDISVGVFRESMIRFSGSEDLGGGLSAIWQVESQVNPNGGTQFSPRNTWVGLKGGWGQVRLGRHDSPYKSSTQFLDIGNARINDFDTILATDGTGANITNTRSNNSIIYLTPNFNGFSGSLMYASVSANEDMTATDDDEKELWSMMAKYHQGPIFATLAYQYHSGGGGVPAGGSSATDDTDHFKVGLGYTFGNSRIGGIYVDHNSDNSNGDQDFDAYYLNFTHKFGANKVGLLWGEAEESDARGNMDDGSEIWSIIVVNARSCCEGPFFDHKQIGN